MTTRSHPIARVATLALACLTFAACHHAAPVTTTPTAANGVTTVSGVGFDGPENLVYDSVSDVYLVSNIGGDPAAARRSTRRRGWRSAATPSPSPTSAGCTTSAGSPARR